MGADLLLISITEKHPERTLEDRLAIVGVITPEEATRLFEGAIQTSWAEWADDMGEAGSELEWVQAKLREALEAIHGGSREVTWIQAGDQHSPRIWVTGGMSWGDNPTEVWDAFQVLAETDLL